MPDKNLHIISFDIPYPANYGGVIDVFYKLKSLHKKGIKIILHCFEYPGRERNEILNNFCDRIYYYPRLMGLKSAISPKPYIVSSRRSDELLRNLQKDNYPILFEGLHSCYYIDDLRIRNRLKIYRESNIEHRYYFNLFKVEKKAEKKLYYFAESFKLRLYQKVLKFADLMFVVSQEDTEYLSKMFPGNKVEYLPSFHANKEIESLTGQGEYALYNGNIEVPENAFAISFLINKVFKNIQTPLVIAGMNPPEHILKLAAGHTNVKIIANPDDKSMFELIRNAHVNVLFTFQATGLKLKLLNTLYKGRFCLVNDKMLNGTNLNELCEIGNSPDQLIEKLNILFNQDFKEENILQRKEILNLNYSNEANIDKLISLIFGG
ncbi:MAG: glycosyltransferase family 1 protein [Bacteroidales bacterium]|nr:glycosyltransferase family 1 protein [Bacteroidales bacterium]